MSCIEHAVTELIAAFTVHKMQVYTSFFMKGEVAKLLKRQWIFWIMYISIHSKVLTLQQKKTLLDSPL